MSTNQISVNNLSQRDKELLWHPLVQHKTHSDMLAITSAKGVYLYDEYGKRYIDAISSWYTCMYGHCNPHIVERLASQMKTLDQIVFSGFTHEPAILLAEALKDVLPDNQQKMFFSDNGSTAVEVAIKMALQYYYNKGEKRNVLLAFEDGFHGDTFGAMSVSGLSVYNGPFEDYFLSVKRIPIPTKDNIDSLLEDLDRLLNENAVAAFIYEPLVQGAAAMKMHEAAGLEVILKRIKEDGILTIADEVMTGFGKTGTNFASDQLAVKPDLICLSKALTAGMLPMGLTSCTADIFDSFLSEEIGKGFFHGHTYTANPLACAAALAGLELLKSESIQENISKIAEMHAEFHQHMSQHPKVVSSRHKGVIYALDLKTHIERYGSFRDQLYKMFMDKGIFLRPLGNTIYIMPPYVIGEDQLREIYSCIEEVVDSL